MDDQRSDREGGGSMTRVSVRELLLAFAIVALALGWWFDRRSDEARFQIQATGSHAYVLDTHTGQVWSHTVSSEGISGDNDSSFSQPKPIKK
jgi:hypothetical protein